MYQVELDSPRRELSVRGFEFIVALSFFRELILRVHLLGVQSSCIIRCYYTVTRQPNKLEMGFHPKRITSL